MPFDILSLRMSDCHVCGKKCRVWQMELAQKKTTIILLLISRSQNILKTQRNLLPSSLLWKKKIQKWAHFWNLWQLTPSISTWLQYVLQEILPMKKRRKPINIFTLCFEKLMKNYFLRKYFCHQEKSPCAGHWIAVLGKMEQTTTYISRLVLILLPYCDHRS